MITGWSISGSDEASAIVCTPEPGMLNWIRFVVFGGGGFALDALMAWRSVHVGPQVEPPVSAAEVTTKVIPPVGVSPELKVPPWPEGFAPIVREKAMPADDKRMATAILRSFRFIDIEDFSVRTIF